MLEYKLPLYPSVNDKCPLVAKRRLSSKTPLSTYLSAFLGIISLFSCKDKTSQFCPENPIKFTDLGFPHEYAYYGTGIPYRLIREDAVKIIDSIFEQNGFDLRKDYKIKNDKDIYVTSSFDVEKKIGYTWLDNKNTSLDCHRNWSWEFREYKIEYLLPSDRKLFENSIKDTDHMGIEDFFVKLSKENSYYELLDLKFKFWQKKNLVDQIDKFVESNPGFSGRFYAFDLLRKLKEDFWDIHEIEDIVNSDIFTIGLFSHYNYKYSARYEFSNIVDDDFIAKEKTMKNAKSKLSLFVQDYIDWARSEGRI